MARFNDRVARGEGRRERHSVLLGALIAALALTASPALAQTQKLTKVTYSEVVRSMLYVPKYVALAKGYFTEQGLEIDLSTAWSGDKGVAALLTGQAEIALLGPNSVVYIERGRSPEKAKIFSALTATDGLFLMSRVKPAAGPFDWKTLKGKTIISWGPGQTPWFDFNYVVEKNGLDLKKDVNIVTNVAAPARLGAWLAGQGDYATFFEPEISKMIKDGTGYPVAAIGTELGPVDYTAFMATDKFIREKPQVVQGFTNAVLKAQLWVASADPKEVATAIAPYFQNVDHDVLANGVLRYREYGIWKTDPVVKPAAIEKMQDLMISGGVLKPADRVTYDSVVVTTFAEKAKSLVK